MNSKNYYGYIYLILDQKENKIYIGQKKGEIEKTKNYFGSGLIISNIQKDRGNYFLKKIVLGVCYSQQELKVSETECKYFFNAFDRIYGYNIAIQDDGGDNITFHPENRRIRLQISLSSRLKSDKITQEEKIVLQNMLNNYITGEDLQLLNYKQWLDNKKELETKLHIESLLTTEERSLLSKSLWENKSTEDKQKFYDKMSEVMNKEDVIAKSKESRKNPEYKKLISSKMVAHCSKPEVREERKSNAIKQWEVEGVKEIYSKTMSDWHSKEENKKKHSNAIRKDSSFLAEKYLKSIDIPFTYYDIIEQCGCTYYIVNYWIKKEIEKGNIVKDKRLGKKILYRRIDNELCKN